MTSEDEDAPDFEADLERLETIVDELEGGDLPLEEAFDRFEEGVELARDLRERLDTVETRVEELLDDGDVVPFEGSEREG